MVNFVHAALTFYLALALQRYLKPKYFRQKMKKEAIYMKTKRTRVALVEAFLADSHIQPF